MYCQTDWYERESENFKIIYRQNHAHLVDQIVNYSEASLKILSDLFNYKPLGKIIINTYDAYDYGYGTATSIPQNYIRLEIEPMEPGYESIPYKDRFEWIISHELVHIAVNDNSSNIEKFMRSMFCKVVPEQFQPLTIFYSLLTNFNRYTPRWHQESIAVFLETWMNGGYGRTLGSFDEMYFRSLVLENQVFPKEIELDSKTSHNSFLLETLFYIYGARFASYLALEYGPKKLTDWFTTGPAELYRNFESKFYDIYQIGLTAAWNDFVQFEKQFQLTNIKKLTSSKLTEISNLGGENFGWVTQPYLDKKTNSVIFGFHRPHQLAAIQELNFQTGHSTEIATLPTPSMLQVSSTAFDENTSTFFFTTNNNQLYRDLWMLNIRSGEQGLLFKDCRMGHITVSSQTKELWGIEHSSSIVSLVRSIYPYSNLEVLLQFGIGDEIQQLSVSPSGEYLAGVLHQSNGSQEIILFKTNEINPSNNIRYEILDSTGSPENISWSPDERYIFWNAYTSGVSNIYRMEMENRKVDVLSHTLRGLFRPLYINQDSLFAFEFTTDGFIPVVIQNKPAEYVPAIKYLGQRILDKYPELMNLNLQSNVDPNFSSAMSSETEYHGFSNLSVQTFVPVISGFQSEIVLGFLGRIADPLLKHDLMFDIGFSPFRITTAVPKFHLKFKYEFNKQVEIGIDHNASDFYDLFNSRKRGMIGNKITLGYTNYWLYDNPIKTKQQTQIALYKNVEFINDNLTRVSEPDFLVAQSIFDLKNQRKSIGSSDYEYGNDFTTTLMVFGSKTKNTELAYQIWTEFGDLSTWIVPHNIFYLKISGGYNQPNAALAQARFYFGGFGNRELDNIDVKQYRKVFRFPGIPIFSLAADNFLKIMIENNFPPIRFSNLAIRRHYLSHIDFSIYSQGLVVKSEQGRYWGDLGGQVNFIFKFWDNLESTLSAGIAKAWFSNGSSWEWFLSFKLLKN